MKIGVIGDKTNLTEVDSKLDSHQVVHISIDEIHDMSISLDYLFHFTIDEYPEDLEVLVRLPNTFVFINTVKTSLSELAYLHAGLTPNIFGFNGLPGFFNRSVLEVTSIDNSDSLASAVDALSIDYLEVADRVGMVTPRVIAMIINEAFYTLQEGTATKEDIDLGMKLGTNYPHGPFEWIEKIGVQNVYELLESLFEDTKDQRYKICPLLKRDYLISAV
ncbi:MAG: 3-hydroxyacyl-CoA dehydrogenase family protein [Bacteroidota bacterium]